MTDDVALMAELGLQAYRFSISWPRVLPDGTGEVSAPRARVLRPARRPTPRGGHRATRHAVPLGPSPGARGRGGWRNRDCADWFAEYACSVARTLGDRVASWATLNEPWCYAFLGHASGIHAPGMVRRRGGRGGGPPPTARARPRGRGDARAAAGSAARRGDQPGARGRRRGRDVDARRDPPRRRHPQPLVAGPGARRPLPGRRARRSRPVGRLRPRRRRGGDRRSRSTGSASTTTTTSCVRRPRARRSTCRQSPYPGVPTYAPADPCRHVDRPRLADHARTGSPASSGVSATISRPAADLHHRERRRLRRPGRRRELPRRAADRLPRCPSASAARRDRRRRRRPRLLRVVAARQLRMGVGLRQALRAGARRPRHAGRAPSATVGGGTRRSPAATRS